jgi:hypothetical protein
MWKNKQKNNYILKLSKRILIDKLENFKKYECKIIILIISNVNIIAIIN